MTLSEEVEESDVSKWVRSIYPKPLDYNWNNDISVITEAQYPGRNKTYWLYELYAFRGHPECAELVRRALDGPTELDLQLVQDCNQFIANHSP